MKTRIQFLVLAVSLAALPGILQAQPSAHYAPGVEGIKGASLPPPGVYFRDYNYFYWADQLNDSSGNKIGPANLDAFTYANLPRLIWITDTKFLGGYVGVDGFLPLVYQQVKCQPRDSAAILLASVICSPKARCRGISSSLISRLAAALTCPRAILRPRTGPTEPGLGYWTFMQTAGATWYIDEEKTWAVSALNRFEFNTEQRDTEVTYGDAYTLEWGVSKTMAKFIDLGAVGYYQQQVTGNSDAAPPLNRVAAVGPEISVAFPKQMFFVSLRYNYEFMADSRAQGNDVTLTLTKRF